jgi:ribosomal-protein-alanine N-acetyltransferase
MGYVLKTEHCLLQPVVEVEPEKLRPLQEDPTVRQYLGDISNPSPEYAIAVFGIENSAGEVIGMVELLQALEGNEVEIVCAVLPKYREQGVATEVCRAVIKWGFAEYQWPRILARVVAENEPSRRLLQRLGMTELEKRPLSSETVYVIEREKAV